MCMSEQFFKWSQRNAIYIKILILDPSWTLWLFFFFVAHSKKLILKILWECGATWFVSNRTMILFSVSLPHFQGTNFHLHTACTLECSLGDFLKLNDVILVTCFKGCFDLVSLVMLLFVPSSTAWCKNIGSCKIAFSLRLMVLYFHPH